MMQNNLAKKAAATEALKFVKSGMFVGLGTGSTAAFVIEELGIQVKNGLQITAVASSVHSEELASAAGIQIVSFEGVKELDLYIDGADEIDAAFNLIKGGGGALLREKILAYHSRQFVVVADETKPVRVLGKFPLPVEVTPFAASLTLKALEEQGCTAVLRSGKNGLFTSDNGNFIVDCAFQKIEAPEELLRQLKKIPGIVEVGLFDSSLLHVVIVGADDGTARYLKK